MTLIVPHFEISGKDDNKLQLENIELKFVTLMIFHFEISGKNDNELQLPKIPHILVTLIVFHFEISSGKDVNDLHSINKLLVI